MKLPLNRYLVRISTTTAFVVLCLASHPSSAVAALLSGFDGDLGSATGTDWTSDGLTTQSFVTGPGNGVTQGTQALSITQPKSPPQLVDMKLITLNSVPLVAANDMLLMDVTVPANVGSRQVWLSFRGDNLFANSPELSFDSTTPTSGTVIWNYAADGLKDLAASYAGSFWTIAIGIRGNDFNGGLPITTIVDNVRFASSVPEPPAIALVLIGFGVLITFKARKGHHQSET